MIFVSVGTYPLQFNRLLQVIDRSIERGFIDDEVITQTGYCTYVPQHQKTIQFLDKIQFDDHVKQSTSLISHAGMGAISLAMNTKKPILVMPRMKEYREIVNDHQLATAKKFEELGHVLSALTETEFFEKIQRLHTFIPSERHINAHGVADQVFNFILSLR